jgi:hypothetical protein
MDASGNVYALCTPQGTPFYVGATVQSVGTRVGQHLRDARHGRRTSQVHELLAQTGSCAVWVLESGIEPAALGARERHWTFRIERHHQLATYHHGGNGCHRQPAHIRRRLSTYAKKRPRDAAGAFLAVLPGMSL